MTKPLRSPHQDTAGAPLIDSVEGVLDLMRSRGGRATSSRRVLLEVLFEGDGHMTAEQLVAAVQRRVPDVHISTVYRNLDDLEQLGVVTHSHLGHGPSVYHLASRAHAHFICRVCGATFEAPDSMFRSLARNAESQLGFVIDTHHFAILGHCAACG